MMRNIPLVLLLLGIVGCKTDQASNASLDVKSSVPGCESGGHGIPNNPHCEETSNPTTDISLTGVPNARDAHKVLWTGSKLIIWGGIEAGNADTGGSIYDPILGTWSPITTLGAPESRAWNPSVFWTGSKMIIWGGTSPISYAASNIGGVYDPNTDSWSQTSTVGAPNGRVDAISVWTGNKLIVWGGGDGTIFNTGGVYDPTSNNWTATNLVGAPTARMKSCGVWTGSKMIVWGGVTTGASVLRSGALYDPANDQWSTMSTVGAPSARGHHSCAWTGSKMIVWGGSSHANATASGMGATFLNDGALYDPVSNSWTPMDVSAAPSARINNFSVWTGARFIVLGGILADEVQTTSGAEYDPTTNSWIEIPVGSLPNLNRMSYPSSAWTGTKMIMWGGINSIGQLMNTGVVYTPLQ